MAYNAVHHTLSILLHYVGKLFVNMVFSDGDKIIVTSDHTT